MTDEKKITFENGSNITLAGFTAKDEGPGLMTIVEKLQKLIEIAWENGFDKGKSYSTYFPHFTNRDEIIFDRKFIKALCKARYGDPEKRLIDHECIDPHTELPNGNRIETPVWVHHIHALAISENRIDYLWEQFCE